MSLLGQLALAMFDLPAVQRLSYRDAFQQTLGVDPHAADIDRLASLATARELGVERTFSNERDEWLDLLLTACVQPTLGMESPTILYDYPATQCALARIREGEPPVAERFELFIQGVELANGYHELCDAAELRKRFAHVNAQRVADGKRPLPEDSRLVAAMEHGLPASSGCALGLDRLLMLRLGLDSIEQVIPFPMSRA